MFLVFLGMVVLPEPAGLWARLLGCLIGLVAIIIDFVQHAAKRRRG
jgi:hypothetical protein